MAGWNDWRKRREAADAVRPLGNLFITPPSSRLPRHSFHTALMLEPRAGDDADASGRPTWKLTDQDLPSYHERNAGRLSWTPSESFVCVCASGVPTELHCREAEREFGKDVAARLKAIFLLGWGGFAAVILIAFAFLLGCMLAPTLNAFAATRCITAFFSTAPQITGLYTVTDMYPFHLQARKLNLWTMGFIVSPFLSPFFLGFLVAHADYKWAYAVGSIYSLIVLVMIVFLGEETMDDRTLSTPPPSPPSLRARAETLLGATGWKMSQYRPGWGAAVMSPLRVVWRPHAFLIMLFGGVEFGLSIGITITNAIFLGTAPPTGFGFGQTAIAGMYATPIVVTLLGEVLGRYGNDIFAAVGIRRNNGVFEAEMRLWMCYVSLPLYLTAFLVLGHGIQAKAVPAVILGWGIGQLAIMLNTTAIYAYLQDCFPAHGGEVSALFNFFRTICGFAVVYFQAVWLEARGGFEVFGFEAAIVGGLFILIVPLVQLKGAAMRAKYPLLRPAGPPAQRTNALRLSQRLSLEVPRQSTHRVSLEPPPPLSLKTTAFPSPSMEAVGLGLGVKTAFVGASTSTVGAP
ncbi:MFS general substrate transporter [Mycena vulgaris]|nr:MFS general substrate transporter [Mycena vulgaris]